MTPGKYDLKLYRGDAYKWQFHLWQDDARTLAVDLTDCTVAAEIRDKSGGFTVVDLACTVTMPNVIDMVMTPADWAAAPPKGVWDLEVTFPDGPSTVLAGVVTVTADVTGSS